MDTTQSGRQTTWSSTHPTTIPTAESIAVLAAIGSVTERIRIGTSIIVIPMRNAVLTAKQLATIDSLTGGRLIVGLGVGWNRQEFRNLGANFKKRGRIEEESIKLMKTLWSSERPVFAGRFYRVEDAVFEPLPAQPGGPPIWLGGNSRAALERALLLADGWVLSHAVGRSPEPPPEGGLVGWLSSVVVCCLWFCPSDVGPRPRVSAEFLGIIGLGPLLGSSGPLHRPPPHSG